jgi:hypothetical protein
MLTRKCTLLAKAETTYGTDAAPTAALNAILAKDVDIRPLGEELVRDFLRSSLSPLPHVIGERYGELKFATELKGSGAAGTVPEIGVLFKGCWFSETINAGVSVVYQPSSAATSSITFYVYRDGLLYKLLGSRGTGELDLSVGKYGVINWTFQGLYSDVTDSALQAGTYNATLPPVIVGASFSIGAYAAVATKLAFNIANQFAFRRDLNNANGIREVLISGWPDRGGSFDPEAVLEATHPFYANWKNGTQAALSVTAGSSAGDRCVITAPKVQYKSITPGDREGIYVYDVPFRLAQNAGDDEVLFTFN